MEEIAVVLKTFGTITVLVSAVIGGFMIARWGIMPILCLGLVLQAASCLMFALQAYAGANLHLFYASTAMEYFSAGIGGAALVAYSSALCRGEFTATQYALLTSVTGFIGKNLSGTSGYLAESVSWQTFFLLAALLPLPALIVFPFIRRALPKAFLEASVPEASDKASA